MLIIIYKNIFIYYYGDSPHSEMFNDTRDTVTLDTHALPEKIKKFFANIREPQ